MGKVYEFGGLSIEHCDVTIRVDGKPSHCEHLHLLLEEHGQTVSCTKCGAQVSAWWALLTLVERYDVARKALLKLRPSPTGQSGLVGFPPIPTAKPESPQ